MSTTTPLITANAHGNVVAQGTTLNANTAASPVTLDLTAHLEGLLQFKQVFPNTAPTSPSGLQIQIGRSLSTTPDVDTQFFTSYVLVPAQNATQFGSLSLPGGCHYTITAKNLDTTSNITYGISCDYVDLQTL